jgi:DNA-binding MarR family transcriptional regulator
MNAPAVSTQEALQLVIAMHRLLRGLRKANVAALHPTQLIVLALLARYGPLRVGELAARIPCPQPTATTTLAGLQTAGLVSREADPADARAARVLITEVGQRTVHSAARHEAEALAALLSTVDEEDLRILRAAIPLLSHLAEEAICGLPGRPHPVQGHAVRRDGRADRAAAPGDRVRPEVVEQVVLARGQPDGRGRG